MSHVEAIFTTTKGSEDMQRREQVEAVAGEGLRNDRYALRTGYWTGVDECQVTLIAGEALDQITGVEVGDGQHRRNLVIRGIDVHALAGRTFRVGEALLAYDRPRPPCRHVQLVSQEGMTKALGRGRGGICARVVQSGVIRPGDRVEVLDAAAV